MLKKITKYFTWQFTVLFLLIAFFFLDGVLILFNGHGTGPSANWAYIFDQLGLGAIGIILSWKWIKKNSSFVLTPLLSTLIVIPVVITHYHSFWRVIFQEGIGLASTLIHIHLGITNAAEAGGYPITRDRYGWAPFALVYELFGVLHPGSTVLGGATVFTIVLAALASGWLAGVISKNKIAGVVTGLLVGISPHSFASLPWPSSVMGESVGIALVVLSVGTWVIGRQKNDTRGILLSLLFLAAALKGGGAVRTMTAGGLLIITDIFVFSKFLNKKILFSWLLVVVISVFFYLSTPPVQFSQATKDSSSLQAPINVRAAQYAELTSKSFVPPIVLKNVILKLNSIASSPKSIWVVIFGAVIFFAGSAFAIYGLFNKKLRLFTWAWTWFYSTVFFAPLVAEGYGSTMSTINDVPSIALSYPGYKYAYLPLVGMHVVIGILFGYLIKTGKLSYPLGKRFYSRRVICSAILLFLLVFRSYEFLKYDYEWKVGTSIPTSAWQKALFGALPIEEAADPLPRAIVVVDGLHNPMPGWAAAMYNGSVSLYPQPEEFYKESFLEKKVSIDQVFAFGWDGGIQTEIDYSAPFRQWLKDPSSVTWSASNFEGWHSTTGRNQHQFFEPEIIQLENNTLIKEPLAISPELSDVFVATPNNINIKLKVRTEKVMPPDKLSTYVSNNKLILLASAGELLVPENLWTKMSHLYYGSHLKRVNSESISSIVRPEDVVVPLADDYFMVGLLCNSFHNQGNGKPLIGKQRLVRDWIELSGVKIPVSKMHSGLIELTTVAKCEGSILKRIYIRGPFASRFKLEEIEVSFPAP